MYQSEDNIELAYRIDMEWLNEAMKRIREKFGKASKVVYDAGDMQPEMLSEKAIKDLINEQTELFAHDIQVSTGIKLTDKKKQQFREDLYVFSGFKTYHELKEASNLLRDEAGNVKEWQQFKDDILAIDEKYNTYYLKAEYEHAVRTMEMASAYESALEQKEDHFFKYITIGDDKVRPSHRELDGLVLPIDHPQWATIYPPNGWHCRCNVHVVPKSLNKQTPEKEVDFKAASIQKSDPMFMNNAYTDGAVFPEKHPYYGDSKSKIHKAIKNELNDEKN